MAKKKKKHRHRHPVVPPVHSAPEAVHAPPARPAEGYATRPDSPEPPSLGESMHTATDFEPKPAPSRPRQQPGRKPGQRRRRRTRTRQYVITGLVIVAIVGAFVVRSIVNGRRDVSFNGITAAAGCGKLQSVGGLDRTHEDGARIKYPTSPPAGGPHDSVPLGSGVYTQAFSTDPAKHPSIYQAVHSLEHAYVIVWYNPRITASELDALSKTVTGQPKVILVPYPGLKSKDKMAMSAWGSLQYCGKPSTKAVEAFIKRFRGASSAPEPLNA
jgi:hypothetical protein